MPALPYNKHLKPLSRDLRSNMTDAERRLWSRIRGKQLNDRQFYRQRIIGNYIADFYCPRAKLVVEVDGSQHYTEEGLEADQRRDDYMRGLGLKVLRFSDLDILRNLDSVVETIFQAV